MYRGEQRNSSTLAYLKSLCSARGHNKCMGYKVGLVKQQERHSTRCKFNSRLYAAEPSISRADSPTTTICSILGPIIIENIFFGDPRILQTVRILGSDVSEHDAALFCSEASFPEKSGKLGLQRSASASGSVRTPRVLASVINGHEVPRQSQAFRISLK